MQRLLLLGLLISSLFCYLEWGQNNSGFLFQLEFTVFEAGFRSFSNVAHPLILLPLIGQILLLISVWQRIPNRRLAKTGVILLGVLVLVIFLVGILAMSPKIFLSALPFLLLAVYYLFFNKKGRTSYNTKHTVIGER